MALEKLIKPSLCVYANMPNEPWPRSSHDPIEIQSSNAHIYSTIVSKYLISNANVYSQCQRSIFQSCLLNEYTVEITLLGSTILSVKYCKIVTFSDSDGRALNTCVCRQAYILKDQAYRKFLTQNWQTCSKLIDLQRGVTSSIVAQCQLNLTLAFCSR